MKGERMLRALFIRDVPRSLRKSALATFLGFVSIAIGVAMCTVAIGVVVDTIVHPLPYREPGRILQLDQQSKVLGHTRPFSLRFFLDARNRLPDVESLAALSLPTVVLQASSGQPERANAVACSASLFRLLGVTPVLGRGFLEGTSEENGVALISEQLWRSRFGASPAVLGRLVQVNAQPLVIIGVMPDYVRLPPLAVPPDVWIPLGNDPTLEQLKKMSPNAWDRGVYLTLWARVRSSVDLRAAAGAIVGASLPLLKADDPRRPEDLRLEARSVANDVTSSYRVQVYILLAAACVTFVLTWANVSNTLLPQLLRKRDELAIRYALGERPAELLVRSAVDAAVITIFGVASGAMIAPGLLRVLEARIPPGLVPFRNAGIDPSIAVLVGSATLLAVLGTIVLTAARMCGFASNAASVRDSGGLMRRRWGATSRRLFVILQVACAVAALGCFISLYRAYQQLMHVRLGFEPRAVLVSELALPQTEKSGEYWKQMAYRVRDELKLQSGIREAAVAIALPTSRTMRPSYTVVGRSEEEWSGLAEYRPVSPDYFSVLGIPIVNGRTFMDSDGSPSCVVSRALARLAFPQGNAIGSSIVPLGAGRCEIIGIADDVAPEALDGPAQPIIYVPFLQMPNNAVQASVVMLARLRATHGSGEVQFERERITSIIRSAAPDVPVMTSSLSSIVDEIGSAGRFRAALLGAVGLAALALATIGAYGSAAAYIAARRRDLTLRSALGATPAALSRSIVIDGFRMGVVGLAIGALTARWTISVWQTHWESLPAMDLIGFVVVSCAVLVPLLWCSYVASRAVSRLDPAAMLREL